MKQLIKSIIGKFKNNIELTEDKKAKFIIGKLENITELTEVEKAYIEKAIMMINYYEDLLYMGVGVRENTAGLKFNVHPLIKE